MNPSRLPIWGAGASDWLKLDCRHYRGDRPCVPGIQGVCPSDCEAYSPMGYRILIVKLAALGDVIRTTAVLPALKEHWPQSHITWVTYDDGARMLCNHPRIDRLMTYSAETCCQLEVERFDLCLSLDKATSAAALAMRVDATERRGFGLSRHGTIYPLNPECVDAFLLGLDDQRKFQMNTKSHQQLMFDSIGLPYSGERYRLAPSEAARERARLVWERHGIRDGVTVVGLNTGAGDMFANKTWPPRRFAELARAITRDKPWRVALFGGPGERQRNREISAVCPMVVDLGGDHDEQTFAALVSRADVMVTGDTMAMHVAIAADVPCVVLFGPTCSREIDLFGHGEKIVTSVDCAPCYRRTCDRRPTCMDDLDLERVLAAVQRWVTPRPIRKTLDSALIGETT
ncbi:MAG: glycosyltransferase family 9 protein [Phycisphaerae bacterium]|nr:glycosyltransferase family 9 protein [Phycisphaerae bacterium]